jgi:hypothetical protein
MSDRRLSDTEWLVVTDLSQAEYEYNTMLVQICLAAIKMICTKNMPGSRHHTQ